MQPTTKRWVRRVVLGVAGAVVIMAGVGLYLLKRPPAVWRQAQALIAETSPEQRAQTAEAVIDRIERESGAGPDTRIDQTFELDLTNAELIAVVAETFDDWAAQRGYEVPEQITTPIIVAQDGRLVLAFQVTTRSWQQVFSGYVDLRFDADGMALGRVEDLTAGSLPVSVVKVGEMLRDQLPDSEAHLAEAIGQWLAELDGFTFRPVLELEERRRARVLAMRVGDDGVSITMRVQDHVTYRRHNELLDAGALAVTDPLAVELPGGGAIADVPTATD